MRNHLKDLMTIKEPINNVAIKIRVIEDMLKITLQLLRGLFKFVI